MLSQKARYALRAMIELARENGQVTAGELAVRADAPRKFLEAILLTLSRQGLVASRRGKFGGYLLGREPAEISFAEIIRLVDGPLALTPCVSRTAFRRCEDCRDLATCALREALLAGPGRHGGGAGGLQPGRRGRRLRGGTAGRTGVA